MQYSPLGKTGYEVSRVSYGGIVSMSDGQDASDQYVSWAIERGVNYFDVAPGYGDAQEKLGQSLLLHRKNVYLACKTEQRRASESQAALENSLRLLRTDYLDVYQLHGLTTDEDFETAFGPGGAMETLARAKREGIARKLGITAHSEKIALRAMDAYDFDTVLFPLNWRMHLTTIMGERLVAEAKKRGMGVLGMKAFVERAWNEGEDRSPFPKSWCRPISPSDETFGLAAMRYAYRLGADTLVPPGNFESFRFAVSHADEALGAPITDAELSLLREKLPLGNPFFPAE